MDRRYIVRCIAMSFNEINKGDCRFGHTKVVAACALYFVATLYAGIFVVV